MDYAVMANLKSYQHKMAFAAGNVVQVVPRDMHDLYLSHDGYYFIKYRGKTYRIIGKEVENDHVSYFVILDSEEAVTVENYRILHDVKPLPGNLVSGVDEEGTEHLCMLYFMKPSDKSNGDEESV